MTLLNRRRFLTISAAATALPAFAAPPVARWRGRALGAGVSMALVGLTTAEAAPLFARIEAELARLEGIFSLYLEGSQVERLNRNGVLNAPAPELLEVLALSDALHRASGGVFDPTIQPLWLSRALGQGGDTPVGWIDLGFDAQSVRFARPGMAITLNGIAQGAVTDRIADLLKAEGLTDVLVDMGEIQALGDNNGASWSVGLATPDGTVVQRLTLRDRAIATSAPMGTPVGPAQDQPHIIAPDGTEPKRTLVAVSASTAAIADGLSTALCLMDKSAGEACVARMPGARVELNL